MATAGHQGQTSRSWSARQGAGPYFRSIRGLRFSIGEFGVGD